MKATLLVLATILTGCAGYRADLADISTKTIVKDGTTNTETRTITTKIKGHALGSAKQTIAQFRASQTDKSQNIGGTGVSQQGGTNVVQALDKIDKILGHLTPP